MKLEGYEHYQVPERGRAALLEAKERILEEPRRFDMGDWLRKDRSDTRFVDNSLRAELNPPCGSVGCLAGEICLSDFEVRKQYTHVHSHRDRDSIKWNAMLILGLSTEPGNITFRNDSILANCVADSLFHASLWPPQFGLQYHTVVDSIEKIHDNARLVAKFINYILEYGIPYLKL